MATYLVTGGAGFIGHHLVARLLADGHKVRIIDNLSTGKRSQLHPQAEFIEVDFTNLEAIRPAFVGIDGVFHVGALPRVPFSVQDPVTSSKHNIMGTVNVLTAARDAKVRRVVYSASSSAYGKQTELPMRVGMMPNPLNPYAVQKYVGELFCENFARLYGMETVSLRYFNVYGPEMADEGAYVTVISVFKNQALANKVLTVEGDGEQSRDFTHVFDVVDANVRAMTSDKVGKGEVLNVGNGDRHTVNSIVRAFGREATYLPPRAGDTPHTQADISKTKELLGWEPKIKFEEGLESLLKDWGFK